MALRPFVKMARILAGITLAAAALYAADLATRDCKVGPYLYDNCMWMALQARLGLPASRLLRVATLEFVGIVLALLVYAGFRCVFPSRRVRPQKGAGESPALSPPETAGER